MEGTLRYMNVTPIIGLLCGVTIFGLLHGEALDGALAVVFGTALKYATAPVLPLYVAMRKWKALAAMCVTTVAILGLSLAVMGTGPFRVYFKDIAPTLNRPNPHPSNSALEAIVMRLVDHEHERWAAPLEGGLLKAVHAIQWIALAPVLVLIFTRKMQQWRDPAAVFAGAALLISWFLIFSPMFWENYVVYLIPLWGWLIWEARRSWVNAVIVVIALAYPMLPEFVLTAHLPFLSLFGRPMTLAGPYLSLNLPATVLICFIAVSRLLRKRQESVQDTSDPVIQ